MTIYSIDDHYKKFFELAQRQLEHDKEIRNQPAKPCGVVPYEEKDFFNFLKKS